MKHTIVLFLLINASLLFSQTENIQSKINSINQLLGNDTIHKQKGKLEFSVSPGGQLMITLTKNGGSKLFNKVVHLHSLDSTKTTITQQENKITLQIDVLKGKGVALYYGPNAKMGLHAGESKQKIDADLPCSYDTALQIKKLLLEIIKESRNVEEYNTITE